MKEFNVGEMVFFIGEGLDFSDCIMHGIVYQKSYSTLSENNSLHLDTYLVYAIDCNEQIISYQLFNNQVFETIDELLNELKNSYEPDFNLDAFDKFIEKDNSIIFNLGIKEKLRTGYQKEALKAELIKEVE